MFRLAIDTANDAFTAHPDEGKFLQVEKSRLEVARILRETANDLDVGLLCGFVVDSNGHTVGTWELSEREE